MCRCRGGLVRLRARRGELSVRMGLGYAKGLRKVSAEALVESRGRDGAFQSAEDLALRVPELNRKELTLLAQIGALNWVEGVEHRRDALVAGGAGGEDGGAVVAGRRWVRSSAAQPLAVMDTGGAVGGGLCGDGAYGGAASDALLAGGVEGRRCVVGGGVEGETGW